MENPEVFVGNVVFGGCLWSQFTGDDDIHHLENHQQAHVNDKKLKSKIEDVFHQTGIDILESGPHVAILWQ